jgi:probable phosphoglycerate mutase
VFLPNIPPPVLPDILLFRHAATDMGDGPRRYIGRTEVSLSREGRAQATAWRAHLAALDVVGAYASPLERARETARLMLGQSGAPDVGGGGAGHGGTPRASGARGTPDSADALGTSGTPCVPNASGVRGTTSIPLTILDDLAEMDLGDWEGLVQMQVQEAWPDAYARRGREPWTFRPPGGECCADVAARGLRALAAMWRDWTGKGGRVVETTCAERRTGQQPPSDSSTGHDHVPCIVAVSHAGLIRSVLCALGHMGHEELLTLPLRHLHCVRLRGHEPDGGGTPATISAGSGASGASAVWRVVSPDWWP